MIALALRSLRWFWRQNLGVVLASACASAVLVGALAVGDSVRASLRAAALGRIGRVDAALAAPERLFRDDLGQRLADGLPGSECAPAIALDGFVANASGERSGIASVLGVDARFFALGPRGARREPPAAGQAFVNEPLARQLGIAAGDSILVRAHKPSLLPREAVTATVDDVSHALRVEVAAVVGDEAFGRFGLRAGQLPQFNVLVALPWLQSQLELEGRANLLLLAGATPERADGVLRGRWSLADAQIALRTLPERNQFELSSERVFLDAPLVETLRALEPGLVGVLGYFVNALRHGERTTPYSVVAALGPLRADAQSAVALAPLLALAPDAPGVVLNEWCARDLGAGPSDSVALDYFVLGEDLRLTEATRVLTVRAVTPLAGAAADPGLMPAFPGLTDAKDCRDWDVGMPIAFDRIRDVDQRYWDEHRGTPKAFVDLATGEQLWRNRFGALTAVRGPLPLAAGLEKRVIGALDPARLGLFFRDVRGPALAAGDPATDFGGLFLGLSFFLIVAALILAVLVFVFGVEQRAREIGLLLAVGFPRARVRRLFLVQAALLAAIGGALGAVAGLGYTRVVLHGLATLWRDAIGANALAFEVRAVSVVGGSGGAVVMALAAIVLALRSAWRRPAVELLASRHGVIGGTPPASRVRARLRVAVALLAPLAALALVLAAGSGSAGMAGAFFGAGALLLIGSLAACASWLHRRGVGVFASVGGLGARNASRRAGRSLAVIALLASGTFLVVAVQSQRLEPPRDARERASGTGGFALVGRSTLPVLRDLGDLSGLGDEVLRSAAVVPLRVRDGDDASCLNLGVPQQPRLLGVPAQALAERGAFRFAAALEPPDGAAPASPWRLLDVDWGEDVVPAIADAASVTWTMHKQLGDAIEYRDEAGRPFAVRIVATLADSILQGDLVVAEPAFRQRFPGISGHRAFLIDASPGFAAEIAAALTRALADLGLELTPTAERLRAFQAVQNTYLLIFQALGGLGLWLGSIGLGVVVLRNAFERRAELAVARAVGYPLRAVRALVWSEHGLLLALGLACGVGAALAAVLPGLRGLALGPVALLVGALAVSGALWVALASALATRGSLLSALREE
jgi:hypothetical protein